MGNRYGIDPFVIIIVCLIVIAMLCIGSLFLTYREVTISAHVSHIDYDDKRFMVISFDDGQSYRVGYSITDAVIDFDESKNVTIRLSYANMLWVTNTNECWSVMNIIKY